MTLASSSHFTASHSTLQWDSPSHTCNASVGMKSKIGPEILCICTLLGEAEELGAGAGLYFR